MIFWLKNKRGRISVPYIKRRRKDGNIPLKASVGLSKPSMALAEQVETLDKNQLLEKLGEVYDEMVMQQITIALQIQIGVYAEYN